MKVDSLDETFLILWDAGAASSARLRSVLASASSSICSAFAPEVDAYKLWVVEMSLHVKSTNWIILLADASAVSRSIMPSKDGNDDVEADHARDGLHVRCEVIERARRAGRVLNRPRTKIERTGRRGLFNRLVVDGGDVQ
jgi:hypothetical protein